VNKKEGTILASFCRIIEYDPPNPPRKIHTGLALKHKGGRYGRPGGALSEKLTLVGMHGSAARG